MLDFLLSRRTIRNYTNEGISPDFRTQFPGNATHS